jgi:hypothetical protein
MSDYEPTPAELRDGERPDLDSHAARNLEQIRRAVEDGILDADDLSPERRARISTSD